MRLGKPVTGLAPAALARLKAHAWPGNVRELENVLERAVLLAAGPVVERVEIGPAVQWTAGRAHATGRSREAPRPEERDTKSRDEGPPRRPLDRAAAPAGFAVPLVADRPAGDLLTRDAETATRGRLVELLRTHRGSVTAAARAAGRNRTSFYGLLKRHDLDPAAFRGAGGSLDS